MKKYIVKEFSLATIYQQSDILEAFLNDPELIDDYDLVTIIYINGNYPKAIYKLKK